jgi:DNA-binding CsgD family transcriptional regulator
MSEWPFVARVDEVQRASQAVRPGSGFRGVVLVGEAGVGKTALARVLAENLESDGLTARFVLGTETGQAVPLGAFHRTLPIEDPHEPAVMLAAAHRALAQERDLVLVVDDAQLLDPLSALLIHQVAANGATPLLVTIRSGVPVPDAVTALWKEHLLFRLDVEAFTRTQTEELVSAVLDGDVDSSVVDHLQELARGSPLVLRGLLNAAREDDVLVHHGGRWRLQGQLRVGAELSDLVESRLQTLDADEFEVVEIVAAAEILDWDILRTLCDAAAISRAEHRGAIQFVADGSHTLTRLGHPVFGEVVMQRCGEARTRQLNTLLAQHLSVYLRAQAQERPAVRPDVRSRIQLARFMTHCDMAPELETIIDAAAGAMTMSNLVLGEQLARFAYERGGLPAAIVLADAISWQGRGQEAEAILAARAEDANGPQVAVFLPELELARSWGRAGAGETTAARDHALRAAQIARSAGMYAVELHTLHTAVRFGDRSQSGRLHQLAAQLKTPLAAAIAAHSRGLADHDGDRLDDAADRFHRIGAAATAADASAHAAREHARAGHRVKELESATRAHWQASQCDLRSPAVTATEDPLPLTDREREIASLVGAGLTNREIADRLSVSVRTVDGHLYRIYSKLRIEDRDQLARLVRVRHAT